MATSLGKIYGTEDDKVNCNFYSKIGACRHGDKCNRIHNKPSISQTILFKHLYQNPAAALAVSEGIKVSEEELKKAVKHFESFYEEIFLELAEYGELEELHVCDNIGDHMIGNVYAKFSTEKYAENAYKALYGKYYGDQMVQEEYSPVTVFKECVCKQYKDGSCDRGGFCNFLHLKYVSKKLSSYLRNEMYNRHPEYLSNKHKRYRKNSYSGSKYSDYSNDSYSNRSRDSRSSRKYSYKNSNKSHRNHMRRHRRSRDYGSLGSVSSEERRRIIKKWNDEWENERKNEEIERTKQENRINLALIQEKIREGK